MLKEVSDMKNDLENTIKQKLESLEKDLPNRHENSDQDRPIKTQAPAFSPVKSEDLSEHFETRLQHHFREAMEMIGHLKEAQDYQ